MNWNNSVMFGKNSESSSSDRTSTLKNKTLFNNKNIQDTIQIDNNNNLSKSKSYTEFYNLHKGFLYNVKNLILTLMTNVNILYG